MCDIYKLARRVVVWLGPEENNSPCALKLMEILGSKLEVDRQLYTIKAVEQADVEWADPKRQLPYGKKEYQALYSLFHRSWFERLWIRQEIQLGSRNAILLCGSHVTPWRTFRNAIFCLDVKPSKNILGLKFSSFHQRVRLISELSDGINYNSLEGLIHESRNSKCSDQRDRIYAMLSILHESDLDKYPEFLRYARKAVWYANLGT